MLLTTGLSYGSLLTIALTAPLQARDGLAPQAYRDVAQVLDRIVVTVTTIGSHVSAWPGNPKRQDTLLQIIGYLPIIKQDCINLVSDLQIGTDWIHRNKQTTLSVVDALYIVPKLAALNSAVTLYKDALLEKRPWADTVSVTPDLYDQLLLQKQWTTQLSLAITQSLSITTSWLGGPVGDFFFGAKLDEAIKAYADGGKYRPNAAPSGQFGGPLSGIPPQQQQGATPPPYYPGTASVGPQNWPGKGQNLPKQQQGQPLPYQQQQQQQQQGQPLPYQQQQQQQGQPLPYQQQQQQQQQQGQPPYHPFQGQGGWTPYPNSPSPLNTAPGVQEQPTPYPNSPSPLNTAPGVQEQPTPYPNSSPPLYTAPGFQEQPRDWGETQPTTEPNPPPLQDINPPPVEGGTFLIPSTSL